MDIWPHCNWTQAVHTSALHGSSRSWCKILRHMGHCSCSRIARLLELASKWSASKDSVGGAIAWIPTMIFCGLCLGCVWLDDCRQGDNVWQIRTNVRWTQMFLMCIYLLLSPIVNSSLLSSKRYSRTAAEARRVSVNYVIAGVNSKDSVQMSCKLLADVWAPCFLFPSLDQEATHSSLTVVWWCSIQSHTYYSFLKPMSSSVLKKSWLVVNIVYMLSSSYVCCLVFLLTVLFCQC